LFVVAEDTTATFSGSEFIYYNFTEEQALSYTKEIIQLQFKTVIGDGLLFYTGK